MPEPAAAFVSAVVASITFLHTAKTAIISVAEDVERFRAHDLDLRSLSTAFTVTLTDLESLQRLWRFNGYVGDTFYMRLWGEKYDQILDVLETIALRIEYLKTEFHKLLGPLARCDGRERRDFVQRNDRPKFWEKLRNSLVGSKLLGDHLSKLSQDISHLEKLAKTLLEIRHAHKIDSNQHAQLTSLVDEQFGATFLGQVVQSSPPYGQALYEEISSEEQIAEAHLAIQDLLTIPDETVSPTATPAGAHSVVYNIIYLTRDRSLQTGLSHRVATARSSRVNSSPSLPCCSSLQHSETRTKAEPSRCTCDFEPQRRFDLPCSWRKSPSVEHADLGFLNHADPHDIDGPIGVSVPSGNVRQLLQNKRNVFVEKMRGIVAVSERVTLAYQLAMFTYLLLHTGWTSHLCSCTVTFTSSLPGTRYYIAVGNDVRHFQPGNGQHHNAERQWCESFGRKPIQRLGLILTEIAMGTAIRDAVLQEGVLEVGFDHVIGSEQDSTPSHVEEIWRMVEEKTGPMFASLVYWCLSPEWFADVGDLGYDMFYQKVIHPLRTQCTTIVEHNNTQRAYSEVLKEMGL